MSAGAVGVNAGPWLLLWLYCTVNTYGYHSIVAEMPVAVMCIVVANVALCVNDETEDKCVCTHSAGGLRLTLLTFRVRLT